MKIFGLAPTQDDAFAVNAVLDGNQITVKKGAAEITFEIPKNTGIIGIYDGVNPSLLYTLDDGIRFNSRDSISMAMESQGIIGVADFVGLLATCPSGNFFITRYPIAAKVAATYLDSDSQAVEFPREFLRSLDPALDKYVRGLKAKRKLLSGLTPTDSLAALEKQVDLLTMLVLTLVSKQPADAQPEWLPALTAAFDKNTSVEASFVEKAIAAIGNYKSNIRALQAEYFKARG